MTDLDAAYHQLLERLFSARRFGVVLGLERLRAVLAALGDPQRRLGALVHVAGTNGKGSTAAMIAAMVRAHGRTAALYTSPHLTSVRERIVFEGEPIGRAALLAAAARVAQAGGDSLTFFEQLTAMALVELAQRAPDVTILEVGLGGRLDATNVVDSDVAVVTGVALDHQAILGDTLEQIAHEKAGIFRRGKPAVIGVSGEAAAVPALYAEALRLGAAPVEQLEEAAVAAVPPLSLRGAHQRRNAAAAVAAVKALVGAGVLADDPAARARGLLGAVHPGRLELVPGSPLLVLDGAHNPHGAAALAAALVELPAPRILVLAVSRDKDAGALVGALLPVVTAVISTAYQQERALPPQELAAKVADAAAKVGAAGGAHAAKVAAVSRSAPELGAALPLARQLAGPRGTVVVAGSLFLVGEARAMLLGADTDPVLLSDPAATPGNLRS